MVKPLTNDELRDLVQWHNNQAEHGLMYQHTNRNTEEASTAFSARNRRLAATYQELLTRRGCKIEDTSS